MSRFDTFVVVDWSARSKPSAAAPESDAIWVAVSNGTEAATSTYYRTRDAATEALTELLRAERVAGKRVFVGFDFPFGYPSGFATSVTGNPDVFSLWNWLSENIVDDADNANNRFDVAAQLNAVFSGTGPFWGRPGSIEVAGVPERGNDRIGHGCAERRLVEDVVPRAQPVWKLYTTGSVGSQSLLGLPRLQKLRNIFGADLSVWPFQSPDTGIVIAEIYPSLIDKSVKDETARSVDAIKDEVQVRLLAGVFAEMQSAGHLGALFDHPGDPRVAEEGWIFGAGHESVLEQAARAAARPDLQPPKLRNDCFALPAGVEWTPVDDALLHLRTHLAPVVGSETVTTQCATGRVLAGDALAVRSNPPSPNSAVDGYGFAHATTGNGRQVLPLINGRAAAGDPFAGTVPEGYAIRILTGAIIPEGVDTVVLEEDITQSDGHIAFEGPVKPGANTRAAGEDVAAGALALAAGHVMRAPDVALLSALGLADITVRSQLRVGVLSTGDEIAAAGSTDNPAVTFDANRPMLLALAARWGYHAVDLGHVGDNREALRATLDAARARADVVLTSGGASAGDEDHVSALLQEAGALQNWRIAVKPGRPLALGLWDGMPVFGLPGNPVAAFVCTLIFARPAFHVLAGAEWTEPQGFTVPAAFEKRKKPGRREYLRARLNQNGEAEVFKSEGSGRISGLSWADGLVELDDGPRDIRIGDPVRYFPYGSFGI